MLMGILLNFSKNSSSAFFYIASFVNSFLLVFLLFVAMVNHPSESYLFGGLSEIDNSMLVMVVVGLSQKSLNFSLVENFSYICLICCHFSKTAT